MVTSWEIINSLYNWIFLSRERVINLFKIPTLFWICSEYCRGLNSLKSFSHTHIGFYYKHISSVFLFFMKMHLCRAITKRLQKQIFNIVPSHFNIEKDKQRFCFVRTLCSLTPRWAGNKSTISQYPVLSRIWRHFSGLFIATIHRVRSKYTCFPCGKFFCIFSFCYWKRFPYFQRRNSRIQKQKLSGLHPVFLCFPCSKTRCLDHLSSEVSVNQWRGIHSWLFPMEMTLIEF